MMKRSLILLLLSLCVLSLICGCKKNSDTEETTISKLADGEFEVYYLTQDGLHLATEVREAQEETPEDLARTLLKIM